MKSVMVFLANYYYIFLILAAFFAFALIGYFMDKKVKDAKEAEKEKTETIKVNENVETLKEETNTTLNEDLVNNLNVTEEVKSESDAKELSDLSKESVDDVPITRAPVDKKEEVMAGGDEEVIQVPGASNDDQIEIL